MQINNHIKTDWGVGDLFKVTEDNAFGSSFETNCLYEIDELNAGMYYASIAVVEPGGTYVRGCVTALYMIPAVKGVDISMGGKPLFKDEWYRFDVPGCDIPRYGKFNKRAGLTISFSSMLTPYQGGGYAFIREVIYDISQISGLTFISAQTSNVLKKYLPVNSNDNMVSTAAALGAVVITEEQPIDDSLESRNITVPKIAKSKQITVESIGNIKL